MPAPTFLSINEFPGDGVALEWDFNFAGGYISTAHVKVLVQDEFGAPTDIPITADDFVSEFRIQLDAVIPVGHTLRIYRETPRDEPLVNFTGGSNFTEANLDILAKQVVFVAAEAFDAGAYAEAFDLLGQAQTAASQAAAALVAALASQSASAASEAAALAAQLAAELAEVHAETAEVNAELAEVNAEAARDAALTYRDAAIAAAAAASASEIAAELAETNAELAEVNAEAARDAAIAQVALATAQAVAADASADAAAASATAANASAVAAAVSAAAAATFDPANFVGRTGGATGAADLPAGTTGQRPATAVGRTRWNTTLGCNETWSGTDWVPDRWIHTPEVALPAATAYDVTDIPSWVNELDVTITDVSGTAASTSLQLFIGEGAILTSGYDGGSHFLVGDVLQVWATAGFSAGLMSAANVYSGVYRLTRSDGKWNCQMKVVLASGSHWIGAGSVVLAGPVNRLRLAISSGSFDGGSIAISYRT